MLPLIHIGPLAVPTYFLLISLATILGFLWFVKRAIAFDLNRTTALDLTATVLICGFIGARLFHVFYEEPDFYRQQPLQIFALWQGGFVYLGGVVAGLIGGLVFCQLKSEPFWFWADMAAPPAGLAYAIGRLACFLNGCCYGKACVLPWAITIQGLPRHPTQLYAAFGEGLIVLFLMFWTRKPRRTGDVFLFWIFLHSLNRLVMEAFREDARGPMLFGASIGTWMALGLMTMPLIRLVRATR